MLKLIFRNWSLKLFALALAVALWASVVGQETAEVGITLPVQLSNLSKDLVLSGEVPHAVQMRLYGPSSLVRRVASQDRAKVIDLAGLGKGNHVFQVVGDDLGLPGSVRVIRVNPARLSVNLVTRDSKKLPVRPILKGDPALGYSVGEVEFSPKEVVASGPANVLKDLDWIWTVPIEVSGLKEDLNQAVQLQLPTGRTLRLNPAEVQAKVSITAVKPEGEANQDSTPNRTAQQSGEAQAATEVVKEAAQEAAKQAESNEPGQNKEAVPKETGPEDNPPPEPPGQ